MKVVHLLFVAALTACASPPVTEVDASARIADDFAVSIRQLAEAKARYGEKHPEVVRIEAAQASLQQSGRSVDANFDEHVREAVNYQLAIARREGAQLALRYAASHPERIKNAAVIAALASRGG